MPDTPRRARLGQGRKGHRPERRGEPRGPGRRVRPPGPGLGALLRGLPEAHGRALVASLGELVRSPFGTLLTMAVIGIALALPAGLLVLLANLETLGSGLQGPARISVFLEDAATDDQARALGARVGGWPAVAGTEVITRAEALAEYQALSGLGDALQALERNPLPPVVVVEPRAAARAPAPLEALVARLRAEPGVGLVQVDLEWVQRLQAMTRVLSRLVWVVAGVLALAVVLVVGNTIRLQIQGRRAEIEVAKLVGATDAFVRRPFLYRGLWYGLGGVLVAWLVVAAGLALLAGPVDRLAALYFSGFELRGLAPGEVAGLALAGAALGLGGSWVAVGRHLGAVQPR